MDLTGGYLLERDVSDKYNEEVSGFETTLLGDQYTIKSPKYASRAEVDYISGLMNAMEKAVTQTDGVNPDTGLSYPAYLDLESYARKYIVEELSKNKEAALPAPSSISRRMPACLPALCGIMTRPTADCTELTGRRGICAI